jgi:valyl-tRNA synthetase
MAKDLNQLYENKIKSLKNFSSLHGIDNASDQWILEELYQTKLEIQKALNKNNPGRARHVKEEFFWNFCDNYLELVKIRIYEKDQSAIVAFFACLDFILTEFEKPREDNEEALIAGKLIVKIIDFVRKYKAEKKVSIKTPIEEIEITCTKLEKIILNEATQDLLNVTSAKKISFKEGAFEINIKE